MDTSKLTRLGYLSANIAGDYRYTDILNVYHDPSNDTVIVAVSSTDAIGGMDGPGGRHEASLKFTETSKPGVKPGEVLKMIKAVTGNRQWNFKVYGKPTKNFEWASGSTGLNVALCTAELAYARSTDV